MPKYGIGMAAAAIFALSLAAMRMHPSNWVGGGSPHSESFRHRDTKKHFSRSGRNRKYKAQRAANRQRRLLGA
jgi:hypothetical protein